MTTDTHFSLMHAATLLVIAGSLSLSLPTRVAAQRATTPGAVTTPHPTLEHISIEWAITGDDDEDGVVTVRFREEGAASWRVGHPLVRVPAGSNEGHSWANRHAGSLFGLRPGTTYEIELTLRDPDGGDATRTVMARTRPVPTVPADARIRDATPSTLRSVLGEAAPGDVVVLGPGTYGSFTVGRDGSAERPIVVRGSDVERVVIDGEVRMDGRSNVWVEDLTVRGQIKFNNARNIVVRGCRIEASSAYAGHGIVSLSSGSTDGYFADNVITGLTAWTASSLGVSGDNVGEGIWVTGPGNVIEHNRVVGFRDCISLLEGSEAREQYSIDILRNDLDTCSDDGIEADFSMGNVRVIQNRLTNTFIGLSSQPSLGGPTWFIRNVSYNNLYQVWKPQRGSVGDIWYHNTVVKSGDALAVNTSVPWSRARFRNNLLIGGGSGATYNGYSTGAGRVLQIAVIDVPTADLDYDGFGSIGTGTFRGRFGGVSFDSLAMLRSQTSEAHAVQVDLSVFAAPVEFPEPPFPRREAADLRLTSGDAVDVGQAIPNINDGFGGAAPDLGAYELGSGLVEYGPRSGAPVCGNGIIEAEEACDDGNTAGDDGCDASCQLERAGGEDGGVPSDDGGIARGDGGVASGSDASVRNDGGVSAGDGSTAPGGALEGCTCSVSAAGSGGSGGWLALLALAFAGLVAGRRSWRTRRGQLAVPAVLTSVALGCDASGPGDVDATAADGGEARLDAGPDSDANAPASDASAHADGATPGTNASASEPAPGGFLEPATARSSIDRLAVDTIVASLPAAGGRFTFPAPYGTEAVRLTGPESCGGADCLRYVGYSYWRNINNHVGRDHLLIVLGLDADDGGSGLTLFRVHKETLTVESLGAVLEGTGLPRNTTGEGVYFSATMPHALYVHSGGRLLRVDVMTKEVETVFDAGARYGDGHIVWQHHTSDDDRVHSFTLRDGSYRSVGCGVYDGAAESFRLFESEGSFDECQVDRSGRWLVIKEDVDGRDGEDNRIVDLTTGEERVLLDRDGAAGHSDLGHGYMIAADNHHALPGAYRVWDFTRALDEEGNGVLAYHDTGWYDTSGDHVSHTNARAGVAIEDQVACNSRLFSASSTNPRGGEIVCYRLDGSLEVLVVAPTMSERGSRDAYTSMPKGNLDITGRWFVWTANVGGDRLDAFLVRVPIDRLLE